MFLLEYHKKCNKCKKLIIWSDFYLTKGNKTAVIPVHGSKELGTGLEKKLRKLLKE